MKTMRKVVYPGSFDPLTYGHLDIIQRTIPLVDKLIIAIVDNPSKNCSFSIEDRKLMICEAIKDEGLEDKVSVCTFKGLLVSFVKSIGSRLIVRGIRALSDFEFEFRSSRMNKHLNSNIETIFILSAPKYEHISSSLIKEVHKLDGDVSFYVPKSILKYLNGKAS